MMKTKPKPLHLPKPNPNPNSQTVLEHLLELKKRIIIWLCALIVCSLIGYAFFPHLVLIIAKPINQPLYYSTPTGAFNLAINISLLFGFFLSLPILFSQIMIFIKPGIKQIKLKYILMYLVFSLLLAITGVIIAYFYVLPPSLKFLESFNNNGLNSLIFTDSYFTFVAKYLLSFALIFQMPLAVLFLHNYLNLSATALLVKLPWVILLSFIAAAILTPTSDFVNQIIMAAPMIILYLASTLLVWMRSISSRKSYIPQIKVI